MDTDGSLKSSSKQGFSFRPTQIDSALLETAKQFLESFQFDTRIRQLLYEDKLEQSVGKHKYYILGNEQKYEPGFLLVMRGKPIVFLNSRLQYGYSLRMRLHASLYQSEAVFIGTLDTIFATFRLEDVWYMNDAVFYMQPFSKRYEALQHFYNTMFVQDKHLSGFMVEVAKLRPLSDLRTIVDSKEFYSVDFVPEHGGRRRWHVPLAFTQQQKKITDAPFNAKGPEKTLAESVIPAQQPQQPPLPKLQPQPQPPLPKTQPHNPTTKFTDANAYRIVGMPDTYSLVSNTNLDLGRAAVQSSGVSVLLRAEFTSKKQESVPVSIQWYEEFQRYKITGLMKNE
jgi:hypothetical protein